MTIQFGSLYIIAAPSGAGKTSLVNKLVEQVDNIVISISHTTRPKRLSERDKANYFFVTQTEFDEMATKNLFLEHAFVFGHSYGTSRQWVENQLARGVDVILEIDWQGALQVKALKPNVISIFILPPSFEALKQRLQARGQDDLHTIEQRMTQAKEEMSHCPEFDYLVINENFENALADLAVIIRARRLSFENQSYRYQTLLKELLG